MAPQMYTVHPDSSALDSAMPVQLAEAARNVYDIQYESMRAMRDTVFRLATLVQSFRPTLVPFFATGAIPYVLPAMHRLADVGEMDFLNGDIFHMFPGLAWSSSQLGATGQKVFADVFPPLLKDQGRHRVLCVDTTGVGNAVNAAVGALLEACASANAAADVRVVGIVNGVKSGRAPGREPVNGANGPVAHVLVPRGLSHAEPLQESEFQPFTGQSVPKNVTLRVAYWCATEIPTEDRAELIGAVSLREELQIGGLKAAGRIRMVSSNGEAPQETGLDSVAKRFSNALSKDDSSMFWTWANRSAALPPASPDTVRMRDEVRWATEGCLRLFELRHDNDAVEHLKLQTTTYGGAEITLLTEKGEFGQPFLGRVRHALSQAQPDDWRLIDVAATYLSRAMPEIARSLPKGLQPSEVQTWWITASRN